MQEGSCVTLYTRKICHSNPRASLCLSPCQLAADLQTRHRNRGVPAGRLCLSETHSHTLWRQSVCSKEGQQSASSTCAGLAYSGRSSINLRYPGSSWNAIGTENQYSDDLARGLVSCYTHYCKASFSTGESSCRLFKQGGT